MSHSNSCFSPPLRKMSAYVHVSNFSHMARYMCPDLEAAESSVCKWSYCELPQVILRIKFDSVSEELCLVAGGLGEWRHKWQLLASS